METIRRQCGPDGDGVERIAQRRGGRWTGIQRIAYEPDSQPLAFSDARAAAAWVEDVHGELCDCEEMEMTIEVVCYGKNGTVDELALKYITQVAVANLPRDGKKQR